jgi:hypothetical protein
MIRCKNCGHEVRPSAKRSGQQNSFYWLYLGVIATETGDNADDLHEFFKRKLLPPQFITVRGEEIKIPASTTDLNKADFGEYMEKICALTGVPIPDPEAAGFISNTKPPVTAYDDIQRDSSGV